MVSYAGLQLRACTAAANLCAHLESCTQEPGGTYWYRRVRTYHLHGVSIPELKKSTYPF
jgi:hypothetical protein